MRCLRSCIGLLLGVLLLSACGQDASQSAAPVTSPGGLAVIATDSKMISAASGTQLRAGDMAPDFSYTLPDGSVHKLSDLRGNSDLRGKKVLINFWATWCGPCQVEMPELQSASQAYAAQWPRSPGSKREETRDIISPFATKYGVTFPLITNTSNDIGTAYGVRGLPTSFFVNSDGTISFRQIGVVTNDFIKLRLQEMQ